MKKILFIGLLAFSASLVSCGNKCGSTEGSDSAKVDTSVVDSASVDSVDSVSVDTVAK